MSVSPMKIVLTVIVVMAMTICCVEESNAQRRGFRIGNVFQAGGGQGFRLGGDRLGMQFGGGQGAIFGGQNFGMRFGNGQGARFGGSSFGMQFGGGQGTQIGRLNTPSTFYNGATPQYQSYRQPVRVAQPRNFGQPIPSNLYAEQAIQPAIAQPIPGYAANVNQGVITSSYVQPTTANFGQGVTQFDIARANTETVVETETKAVAPPTPVVSSTVLKTEDKITAATTSAETEENQIRLSLSADAKEAFSYQVNGLEATVNPGESVLMNAGEQWKIEFDAGSDLGGREAVLKEGGTYAFEKTDTEGWVLMKNSMDQPTTSANEYSSGN